MDENVELERAYASVIGRVAVDSEFRAALVANPAAVLKSQGIDFPEGVELEVLEASATKGYIVLPDQSVVSDGWHGRKFVVFYRAIHDGDSR